MCVHFSPNIFFTKISKLVTLSCILKFLKVMLVMLYFYFLCILVFSALYVLLHSQKTDTGSIICCKFFKKPYIVLIILAFSLYWPYISLKWSLHLALYFRLRPLDALIWWASQMSNAKHALDRKQPIDYLFEVIKNCTSKFDCLICKFKCFISDILKPSLTHWQQTFHLIFFVILL